MLKAILKIFGFFIFLYFILCLLIFFFQKKLIFFPIKNIPSIPQESNIEEIYIKTENNILLNAWFINNNSDKTVIFFHGNGGNIFYNKERIQIFNELKINAILFDYRGYGKSEGEILTEDDLYKDAEAIFSYLEDRGISSRDIILWGQSLGGAIAINTAQDKDVGGVIIESSFYSMEDMAKKQYWFVPVRTLLKFDFENNKKIKNIKSPVLIIHSKNDEIINYSNGLKLFNLANNPKYFLETKGSHNGGFQSDYKLYVPEIEKICK